MKNNDENPHVKKYMEMIQPVDDARMQMLKELMIRVEARNQHFKNTMTVEINPLEDAYNEAMKIIRS